MFRERGRVVDAVLRAFDLVALTASVPVAYLVRDGIFGEKIGWPGLYPFGTYRPLLVLTLFAWVAVASLLRLYQAHRMPTLGTEIYRAARTLVVVAAVVAAVGFLAKQAAVSRLFVGFYFGVAMLLLAVNRLLLRRGLSVLRRRGYTTRIVAVVGTTELAHRVGEGIKARGREWGYHLAGYIEEDVRSGPREVGPLLGSVSRLKQLLDNKILDEIIFAVPQERFKDIEEAVVLCRREGVTARICLDIKPAGSRLSIDELNGVPMLGFYEG